MCSVTGWARIEHLSSGSDGKPINYDTYTVEFH